MFDVRQFVTFYHLKSRIESILWQNVGIIIMLIHKSKT